METQTSNHNHIQQPMAHQPQETSDSKEQVNTTQEMWRPYPYPCPNPPSLTLDSITTVTMPVLAPGNNGEAVRFLQQILISRGYHVVQFNANYDRSTYQGVLEFQRDHGLAADGVVGWHTWRKLGEVIVSHHRHY